MKNGVAFTRKIEVPAEVGVEEKVLLLAQLYGLEAYPAHQSIVELAKRAAERNDLGLAVLAPGRHGLEAPLVVHVPGEDLLALGSVHARRIGLGGTPL